MQQTDLCKHSGCRRAFDLSKSTLATERWGVTAIGSSLHEARWMRTMQHVLIGTTDGELCATCEHQKLKRYELLAFRMNATGKMVCKIEPHPWPLTAVPTFLSQSGLRCDHPDFN